MNARHLSSRLILVNNAAIVPCADHTKSYNKPRRHHSLFESNSHKAYPRMLAIHERLRSMLARKTWGCADSHHAKRSCYRDGDSGRLFVFFSHTTRGAREEPATVEALADNRSLLIIYYFLCDLFKRLRLVGRLFAKLRYKATIVARVANGGLYKIVNSICRCLCHCSQEYNTKHMIPRTKPISRGPKTRHLS